MARKLIIFSVTLAIGIMAAGGILAVTTMDHYFKSASAEADMSHGSGTFQQVLRLATDALVSGGVYRISWNTEYKMTVNTNDFVGRVQLNDATNLATINVRPSATNSYFPWVGFYILTATGGVYDIDMDIRALGGLGKVHARKSRLAINRKDP